MRMLSIPALTISVIRIKTMSNLLIRCSTSLGLSNSLVVEIAKEECPKPDVSSLISAGEAFKHLKNNPNGIKFIDASWHLNKTRNAKEEFLVGRIPGASFFDIDDISDKHSNLPHMLPSEKVFEEKISSMGISSNNHIIVYASAGSFSAPRVWWTFKAFGHDRVSVINGGLPAWVAADGPVESGPYVEPATRGTFSAKLNSNMVVDRNYVMDLVTNGFKGHKILDARSRGRFLGIEPEPRPGLPSGHMPGSLSLPFTAVVSQGDVTRFRPPEELSAAFKEAGLLRIVDSTEGRDDDANASTAVADKVVLSCGSGVSAAVLCLALDVLGRNISQSVAIYDGSWTEWASSEGSPIETNAE